MKLHLTGPTHLNLFSAYGDDFVAVNGTRRHGALIVTPERLITDWSATSFDALAPEHFAPLVELAPEIVLLGTGRRLRFPRPEITRLLIDARIGVEVMDVPAACRTYNILVAEDRKVAAALLVA